MKNKKANTVISITKLTKTSIHQVLNIGIAWNCVREGLSDTVNEISVKLILQFHGFSFWILD